MVGTHVIGLLPYVTSGHDTILSAIHSVNHFSVCVRDFEDLGGCVTRQSTLGYKDKKLDPNEIVDVNRRPTRLRSRDLTLEWFSINLHH